MNETITYVKDFAPIKIIFGVFCIIVFLFGIITGGFPVIFLILGIWLLVREGSEIDLHNKKFRILYNFLGLKFGKWKEIPKFEYVSVFNTNITQQINVTSASARIKNNVILLNLFYDNNKHYTFYKTSDVKKAFAVANHFKLALDIDILDATTKEKKWL